MTREDLFRAVGEVREDQIEAAETVKKRPRSWRSLGALAACLALVVAAAVPWMGEQLKWRAVEQGFRPGVIEKVESGGADAGGGGASAGGSGDIDGSDYWTDDPARPPHPGWSVGVEIGQLSGPGNGETMVGMSSCLAWMSPEEIFAQDTAIFRGTVREVHYFLVEPDSGGMERYYTRAVVEVTDSIRGGLAEGEAASLLWLGARGYMATSISGVLDSLDVGDEAVFMPIPTSRDTVWEEGNDSFCYADVADFYLSEGQRYVFADTAEGLAFDRGVYEEMADVETLDGVAAYIRAFLGKASETDPPEDPERARPAAVPVKPQAEPAETRQAFQEEPGYFPEGPAGALELPGGAFVSE